MFIPSGVWVCLRPFFVFCRKMKALTFQRPSGVLGRGGAELGVGLMLRPRPFLFTVPAAAKWDQYALVSSSSSSKGRWSVDEAAAGMVPPGRRKMSSKICAKAARSWSGKVKSFFFFFAPHYIIPHLRGFVNNFLRKLMKFYFKSVGRVAPSLIRQMPRSSPGIAAAKITPQRVGLRGGPRLVRCSLAQVDRLARRSPLKLFFTQRKKFLQKPLGYAIIYVQKGKEKKWKSLNTQSTRHSQIHSTAS